MLWVFLELQGLEKVLKVAIFPPKFEFILIGVPLITVFAILNGDHTFSANQS